MEETAAASNKRSRDGEIERESPESKRIRADLFFFDDEEESEPDNTDLDSVMRSLQEEIGLPADPLSDPDMKRPDLGFLLEASDDELGLPPAEAEAAGDDVEVGGFGKIWGFGDDEIHLDLGFGSDERREEDNLDVIFDGGLFDFDGGFCGPADFSDLTWRPEFLPAL